MSSSFIQLCNDIPSDISSSRIIDLQTELQALATCFDFIGATYFIAFSKNISIKDSLLIKPDKLTSHEKWHNFIYSNQKMKRLRQEYLKKAIKFDPNLNKIKHCEKAICCYEGDNAGLRICRDTLDKYQVKSRLSCMIECDDYPEFNAHFLFMSSLSSVELEDHIEQCWPEIRSMLHSFHHKVFYSKVITEINPITGIGLISNKGMEVLKLVSLGYSRTEISEMLFLTERGVDYHVNKLKVLLNAKNNAQLIRESFRLNILS